MYDNYLHSVKKQFEYYKILGEKSIQQLEDSALFWQYNDISNSIAIIVNHLHGNMMSRWTDFLTSDGEKEWRNRDSEFDDAIHNRADLMLKWNEGWNCLFKALETINKDNFTEKIYIRNQEHTITESINRQMMHYAYHVGQIVFISKMIQEEDWQSLSIPKGASKEYNDNKFSKGKHKGHFTDYIK